MCSVCTEVCGKPLSKRYIITSSVPRFTKNTHKTHLLQIRPIVSVLYLKKKDYIEYVLNLYKGYVPNLCSFYFFLFSVVLWLQYCNKQSCFFLFFLHWLSLLSYNGTALVQNPKKEMSESGRISIRNENVQFFFRNSKRKS